MSCTLFLTVRIGTGLHHYLCIFGPPFSIKGGHMLHWCLSVVYLSVTRWHVLKRYNIAGEILPDGRQGCWLLWQPNGIQKDGNRF